MTLLPIVERELRVAARRKSTYRIRSWTAAAAMLSFGSLITFFGGLVRPDFAGRNLFTVLTACTFALCLLAGVFLTADCLSAEKREGTMGLLFLTDLKGYDVVLGKFTANSLNAFYGLLAVLPILAIPLLIGGVTGGEFWRMALALANALFFSLAAGIWLSALHREARRARRGTFGLLVFLIGGLPALAAVASFFGHSPAWSSIAGLSPASPFWEAKETVYVGDPGKFWRSLFASQLLGWLFVMLASLTLPHRWQERPKTQSSFRARAPSSGARAPAQWLDINPVLWLIGRNRLAVAAAWTIVLIWGAAILAEMLFPLGPEAALFGNFFLPRPFAFLLKVVFAFETCRFFANARRNGELEMLLCTPLTSREIFRGQALALSRTFLAPVALFLGLWFLLPLFGLLAGKVSDRVAAAYFDWWATVLILGREAADIFATYWFGLWMALTTKRPRMAAPLTIFWVLILPSFLCGLDFIADLALISWSASKLQKDLRKLVAQEYQRGPENSIALAPPGSSPVPPVISR